MIRAGNVTFVVSVLAMLMVSGVAVTAGAHVPVEDMAACPDAASPSVVFAPLPTFDPNTVGSPVTYWPPVGSYNFCAYMDTAYCSLAGFVGLFPEIEDLAALTRCIDGDINGPLDSGLEPPLTPNGIPDGLYEMGILAAVLNDASQPLYMDAYGAMQHNFVYFKDMLQESFAAGGMLSTVNMVSPYLIGSVSMMLAGYATLGDPTTYEALDELLGLYHEAGLLSAPGSTADVAASVPEIGPEGDADGDTYTNREEYEFFVDMLGYDAESYVNAALSPGLFPNDLIVLPDEAFIADGYEGGPFAPATMDFTLSNTGVTELHWVAAGSKHWVTVSPDAGSLAGGNDVVTTVGLDAAALTPGNYSADVTFVNLITGVTYQRGVFLTVHVHHGAIAVADGIPPVDDQAMPYGNRVVGLQHTEQITVHNTNAGYDLIIEDVDFYGGVPLNMFSVSGLSLPHTIAPQDAVIFDVIYAPITTGPHQETLGIASNDLNAPLVYVALSGTGVTDHLEVTPAGDFEAEGYMGGPFAPDTMAYTLFNNGIEQLNWTAAASESWVTLSNNGGVLGGGASTDVIVGLDAETLPLGEYSATVTFTNTDSSYTWVYDVVLTVIEPQGVIEVTDSVPPTDDHYVPFGDVLFGRARAETVTVHNVDPQYDLWIDAIAPSAIYYEDDFNDGTATGWQPTNGMQWAIASSIYHVYHGSQMYRASDPYYNGLMQAMYMDDSWSDAAFEVTVERTATYQGDPALVFMRASDNFVFGSSGDGYGAFIFENGYVSVFRQTNGEFYSLHDNYWPYLHAGNTPNRVRMETAGDTISVYFNDALFWTGTDNAVSGPGYIGVGGFTASHSPTTYYFGNILVYDSAPQFHVENTPDLPFVLGPGESLFLTVVFEPTRRGQQTAVLRIDSSDAGSPETEVLLIGAGVGRRYYVMTTGNDNNDGSSWASAKATIEAALNAAAYGDDIWVAAGTYYPVSDHGLGIGDRGRHFRMKNGVHLYGGFEGVETKVAQRDWRANVTRLSGDIGVRGDATDNCYHVIYHPRGLHLDETTRLDGFTISDGNADGSGPFHTTRGGGIYNWNNSIKIANCVIENNVAGSSGGGASITGGRVVLSNCAFNNNKVIENDFGALGGGLAIGGGSHEVVNCVFDGNTAEASYSGFAGAGAVACEGNVTFINCTFTNNFAKGMFGGGAMFFIWEYDDYFISVINCTFYDNVASYGQGGAINVYSFDAVPDVLVTNSILYNNSPNQIYSFDLLPVVTYSNVQGGFPGAGNMDVDPLFMNAAAANFRLHADSPCIAAGDPAGAPPAPETDIRGVTRPQGAGVDMGAYERVVDVEDDLLVTPDVSFNVSGCVGGAFAPLTITYTLENTGVATVNWTAAASDPWITVSEDGGALAPGAYVEVIIGTDGEGLPPGGYDGSVTFTNTDSTNDLIREVHLAAQTVDRFVWDTAPSFHYVNTPFIATVSAVDARGNVMTSCVDAVAIEGWTASQRDIGQGQATWEYPLRANYHDARTQVIYLHSELGGAGRLTGLALDVEQTPGRTLGNWTIRMKHTNMDVHAPAAWEGPDSGWTTVYQADAVIGATGWVWFDFTTPFDYDGESNLMIDYSFNNNDWATDGLVRCSTGAMGRSLYYYSDSWHGNPLDWTGATSPTPIRSANIPNIQLAAEEHVAVSPTMSGAFVDGVWTGEIAVMAEAGGMFLRAVDGAVTGDSNVFDVYEAITVTPDEAFCAEGYEGGPFMPETKSYVLHNTSTDTVTWSVQASENWVTVSNADGVLEGITGFVVDTAALTIGLNADALAPGAYDAVVSFTNTGSNYSRFRDVTLIVNAIPGVIEVTDSVPPADDHDMSFGNVFVGASKTGDITVANVDPLYALTVDAITLAGHVYVEDFLDSAALGWETNQPDHWFVHNQQYIAMAAGHEIYSAYTDGGVFDDCAVEASMEWEDGDGFGGVFARASEDFAFFADGSAYGAIADRDGFFMIWRQLDGGVGLLDSGFAPYWNSGYSENVIRMDVSGNAIQVSINDEIVWSGTDSALTYPGYTGLCVAPWDNQTVWRFDQVRISWEGDKEHFRLENMPALPVVLDPLDAFEFTVVYEPGEYKTHTSAVLISNNDADTPMVEVMLSGVGVPDPCNPDEDPPEIALVGPGLMTVECGDAYNDPGVAAWDDCDGDISDSVVIDASEVDTQATGSYTVAYNVNDTAGNAAEEITRIVEVVDTEAPLMFLLGDEEMQVECGHNYVSPGALAWDACDGDISSAINIDTSDMDVNAVGFYTVVYTVTDGADNAAEAATRIVEVVDTAAPVIFLLGDAEVFLECGFEAYQLPGALAWDACDGVISDDVIVDESDVDVDAVGLYTATYNVSDSAGNAAGEKTRLVTVQDTTGPEITLYGDPTVALLYGVDTYDEAGATAWDACDGDVSAAIVIDAAEVNTNAVGSYTVTYDVQDSTGNATQETRSVIVYEALGVQPLDDITLAEGAYYAWRVTTSDGAGEISCQWQRFDGGDYVNVVDGAVGAGVYAGATTDTLTFDPFTEQMAGMYRVEASDMVDTVYSEPAEVIFEEPAIPATSLLGLFVLASVSALGGAAVLRRRG